MFEKLKSKLHRHKSKGGKDELKGSAEREQENVDRTPAPAPAAPTIKGSSATKKTTPEESQTQPPKEPDAPKDRWEIALKQLPAAKQEKLKSLGLDKLSTGSVESEIDELVSLVNKKQEECEKKFWRVSIGDNDIVLRNYTTKIVGWLEKAGDIAVQFAPPQASMPWSVVKSLMQIPVIGEEQMGALLGTTEAIVRIVSRGQVYEQVYLVNDCDEAGSKLSQSLEGALIGIYRTSLDLLADSGSLFSQNTARRTLEAILNPGNVSGGLSALAAQEDELLRDVQACESRRSAAADDRMIGMLDCLNAPLVRVDENVQKLLDWTDEEDRKELLKQISAVQFGKHHDNVKETRTPGTGEWLLQDKDFQRWEETKSSGIFWLQGSPGTGKTYLTSRVVDLIKGEMEDLPRNEGFAFFYCNRNEKDRRDALAIISSYVRQLSTSASNPNSMQIRLKELCKQAEESGTTLSFDICQEQILASLNLYSKTTLVIDAFDECDQDSRDKLIETFNSLLAESKTTLKIYIASRPDPDIQAQLQEENRISMTIQASQNAPDIQRFLDQQLDKLAKKAAFIGRMKAKIVERLLERCQGMFQWASLQVHQITRCRTESSVWKRLDNLPEDLQKAYDEIWDQIESLEDPDRTFVERAMKWVMAATEPLDSKCLLSAVRVGSQEEGAISGDEIDEQGLLSICGNFLIIDLESHWRFSHLSVVEYLETAHQWSTAQAHSHVAIACLSFFITAYEKEDPSTVVEPWYEYDSEDEDSKPPDTLDILDTANHFHLYTRHHWVEHVHEAQSTEESPVGKHLKTFLGSPEESSVQYRRWLAQLRKEVQWDGDLLDDSHFQTSGFDLKFFENRESKYAYGGDFIFASELEPTDRPVFAMCRFAFDSILSEWWDSPSIDVSQKNDLGHDLLTIAAISGSESICQRLIEKGADVNSRLAHSIFGTALVAAAWWDNTDVIKCLVEAGADPNTPLNSQEGCYDTNDYETESCISSEDRPPEGWYASPLSAAVENNCVEATKYLVNVAKADIHKKLTYRGFGNVLEIAASNGNHEIIKCLVQAGADVNKPPLVAESGRIIDRALAHGDLKIIRFLIEEAGADVKGSLPGSDTNVLAEVVANQKPDGVKYLVEECHLDVNQTSEHDSPLTAAARNDDLDLVRYLIEHGANVNKPSGNGQINPLGAAAEGGYIDTVRYLVKNGADSNYPLPGGQFDSPFIAALASSNSEECATFLLENGADVNQIVAGKYGSPLVAAASRGHLEFVQRLLERGADARMIVEGEYGSALAAAASSNSLEIVKLLLQAGADVNAPLPSTSKGSALAAAACTRGTGSEAGVTRCLLDAGAVVDMLLKDEKYPTALSVAAAAQSAENIKPLLEAGADPNLPLVRGSFGSALAVAADTNNIECMELLLEGGADANMQLENRLHGSALAVAATTRLSFGTPPIPVLIKHGADVNMPLAGKYPSALAAAVCEKYPDHAETLIKAGADANVHLTGDMALYGNLLTFAALHDMDNAIEILNKGGADVNANPVGKYGSALVAAAYFGAKDCVERLISDGANVNLRLEKAPFATALQAAKTPLAQGDYLQIEDNLSKLEEAVAEACSDPLPENKVEVVQLLEKHGATA
ncbi:ankyrin repeat-containing domain protein [Aspergillus californicus]